MPTIRGNLSDQEHRQFSVLAADLRLTRTQLTERLARGFLAEQLRLHPALAVGIVEVIEETRVRLHITTRQLARLKDLQELVPGCCVNDATRRDLTYPLRFEAVVFEFLANCPKGSKNEAKRPRRTRVYTKIDPTAKPGLKAAKKERAKYESKHVRIITEAEKVLTSGPKSLDELFSILRVRDQVPGGKDPKPLLRSLLTQSGRFTYDRLSKVVSIRQPEPTELEVDDIISEMMIEEPPPVVEVETTEPEEEDIFDVLRRATDEVVEEPPPVSETKLTESDNDPKNPSFFPSGTRWKKV